MNYSADTLLPRLPETIHVLWVVAWLVLVCVLFTSLLALTISRWGRSQPVRICVVLSLLAHVLLAGYAATVRIAAAQSAGQPAAIEITFGDDEADALPNDKQSRQPWEQLPSPAPLHDERFTVDRPEIPSHAGASPLQRGPEFADEELAENAEQLIDRNVTAEITQVAASSAAMLKAPSPESRQAVGPSMSEPPAVERLETNQQAADAARDDAHRRASARADVPAVDTKLPQTSTATAMSDLPLPDAAPPAGQEGLGAKPGASEVEPDHVARSTEAEPGASTTAAADASAQTRPVRDVPTAYRLRVSPNRSAMSRRFGGNPQAEAAVKSGLRWLAGVQEPDGRWDADHWGGGRDAVFAQQNRQQAGANADTGITGLALLAFLGAGHTHADQGPYQETVRRGLEFLLSQQAQNGSLAGNARLFAAMYCHGMSAFALSEAYAMTNDHRLRPAVQRAVQYTLAAQHPTTGGWRYQPGDRGDTSQLGWQVMALKSAELAGIPIPSRTRQGVQRYLKEVSSGTHNGLAGYRPGQRPTTTMTAEALVCRLFMGSSPQSQTATEAAQFVVTQLPGTHVQRGERMNFYFWYYAALALFQRQDDLWSQWNAAMQSVLVDTQSKEGELAGSWTPNTVWGGYGGRVYTTAMATLCLEVYYRFLPVYGTISAELTPVSGPLK